MTNYWSLKNPEFQIFVKGGIREKNLNLIDLFHEITQSAQNTGTPSIVLMTNMKMCKKNLIQLI